MESFGKCSLCGNGDIFVKYDFGEHQILRCKNCTFMWLNPQPSAEDLSEVYGYEYFNNKMFFTNKNEYIYGYYDYLSEKYIKQQYYDDLIDTLIQFIPSFKPGETTFIDVGCGLGYLLDVAFDKGFTVEGVEYNPAAAEKIRKKYRFPIFAGDLADYDGGPFDAVAMLDVIEHFKKPFVEIQKVASIMKPGSVLMLTTMDCDSLVSKLLGKRVEDFRRTREHLFFFTRKTIRLVLEREGLEILQIQSYGLPIKMDFLTKRIKLASPLSGAIFERFVKIFHLRTLQFHFDPHTKMVVYARKK